MKLGLPESVERVIDSLRPFAKKVDAAFNGTLDEALGCLVLSYVIIATFWRLRYGIDFSDEAFYGAITQRFALGDLPYKDDWNLRQTASLLPVPFYWLYLKLRGAEGTIYFLRVLYFCAQAGVAWTVYRFAILRLPRAFALVAASMPFAFVPFLIPTCSYNSLAALFFAAGAFEGMRSLLDEPTSRAFLRTGVLHGLACVAYPPMAIPVAASALALPIARALIEPANIVVVEKKTDEDGEEAPPESKPPIATPWLVLFNYGIGIAIVGTLLVLWLSPGLAAGGVRDALNYEHMTTRVRSIDKAKEVLNSFLLFMPTPLAPQATTGAVTTLAVLAVIAKVWGWTRPYIIALVVAYIGYAFQDKQTHFPVEVNSVYMATYFGVCAGFFLAFVGFRREGRAMVLVGWLPSVFAGFITAFATANGGCVNGGIGLFAAATLSMIAAPMAANVRTMPWLGRSLTVLAMAAVPVGTVMINMQTSYRAGLIVQNTATVHIGPYRGMHAMPQHAQQAEDMTRDMREVMKPGERMLSYYAFPAAYMVAPVKPAMPSVWTDDRANLRVLLPYYQQHRTGEGVVLVLTRPPTASVCAELEQMTEVKSRLLKDRGWYKIYREAPP